VTGDVIGILVGGMSNSQGLNFAVSANSVRNLILGLSPSRPNVGFILLPPSRRWMIVPGESVGPIRMRMTSAEVAQVLGAPDAFCVSRPVGTPPQELTTLYFAAEALVVSILPTTGVGSITIIPGFAPILQNNSFLTCSREGVLSLASQSSPTVISSTSNGLGVGSTVAQLTSALGTPQTILPPVPETPRTNDDMVTAVVHRLLFMPAGAQLYGYDHITFGIENLMVVAITTN
jgi:hypothetical protein